MVENNEIQDATIQPHQAPDYKGTSTLTKNKSSNRNRQNSSSHKKSLSLARTASHREVYDSETRSFDNEFGGHSRRRHEDYPELHHKHSEIKRPNSSSSIQQQQQQKEKGSILNEFQEYENQDRLQRQEQQEILQDVQSGHSGESIVEMYEGGGGKEGIKDGKQSPNSDKTISTTTDTQKNSDLEKQEHQSGTDQDDNSSNHSEDEEHDDQDLVTWDSPDSMENPRNWSLHRRWAVIAIVSSYTFLSPLSSSMIAPALELISSEFKITSTVEESLMLSVFVLAYAIGPMILGPLSEMFGRRIVLQITNVFFIVFTIACAVAQNRIQLSIFRFFAGFGGSAPLSIGGGTVADLMAPDERGTAMSVYSLGPLLGPALGPIIGGWIVQRTGNWRWIFGVASIAAGVTASIGFIILPETYAPRILSIKAKRLRKETGNEKLHTIFDRKGISFINRLEHNLIRPFILISTQPIIILLSLYMMIMYGTMYLVLTTFESVFRTVYHESVGIASLNYISLAIGFTFGGQIGGRLIDKFYKKLREKNNGKGIPEFKLPIMMATCWCLPAGLIIYGWSTEYAVHWIVPNIGAVLLAIGMLTNFQCIQNYAVDSFGLISASALAALVFLRSLAGFALPLAGPTMYQNLGYGWGNTVLAFIAAAIGIPAPFLLFKFGPYLRKMSKYASESA